MSDDSNAVSETSNEAQAAAPAADAQVEGKKFKFSFKTTETVVKDDEGKEISRVKNEPHPVVEAVLPVPKIEDVIGWLQAAGETETVGDKQVPTIPAKIAAMIMEGVHDLVYQAARGQIADYLERAGEKARFTPNNFDLSQLALSYLCTVESGRRGAYVPSESEMVAFCAEYTSVLINTVRYEAKRVKVHCEQFAKGFTKVRNDKAALAKLRDFLTMFAANASEQAMTEHESVYTWLMARSQKYLEVSDKNFSDAL